MVPTLGFYLCRSGICKLSQVHLDLPALRRATKEHLQSGAPGLRNRKKLVNMRFTILRSLQTNKRNWGAHIVVPTDPSCFSALWLLGPVFGSITCFPFSTGLCLSGVSINHGSGYGEEFIHHKNGQGTMTYERFGKIKHQNLESNPQSGL
jgi:hypothetical protein